MCFPLTKAQLKCHFSLYQNILLLPSLHPSFLPSVPPSLLIHSQQTLASTLSQLSSTSWPPPPPLLPSNNPLMPNKYQLLIWPISSSVTHSLHNPSQVASDRRKMTCMLLCVEFHFFLEWEHIFVLCSSPSYCSYQIPDKKPLKGRYILAHSLRACGGKSWSQELGVAGHSACTVEKEREECCCSVHVLLLI